MKTFGFRGETAKKRRGLDSVSAVRLKQWLAAGDTLLVDIRESEENARWSLPNAVSVPLSQYPARLQTAPDIARIVFHCQSGKRTRLASHKLAGSTDLPSYMLLTGIEGWDIGGPTNLEDPVASPAQALVPQLTPNVIPWPPILFGSALLVSWLMDRWEPIPIPSWPALGYAGIALLCVGVALDLAAMFSMRRQNANILPHRPATALVTCWPFSISRNPIYLGNTIALIGIALVIDNPWLGIGAVAAALAVTRLAIYREEAHLSAAFGSDYEEYADRVPRWFKLLN